MPAYSFEGLIPVVHPTAFVHPTAVLIGDAIVGARCYVGPGASLRGDFGRVQMEEGSNLQDNCVMHSFPGKQVVIEVDATVGHSSVLHGCRIGRHALIGINSVILDEVMIGEGSLVAAKSFVKSGMEVAPRSLIAGAPARVIRELTDEELHWISDGAKEYQMLAQRCLAGLHETTPLSAIEPHRRLPSGEFRSFGTGSER